MENKKQINESISKIFLDIGEILYKGLSENITAVNLETVLEFDDLQRVSNFKPVIINGKPKIILPGIIADINKKALDILKLPKMFNIKSLSIKINGGKYDIKPTYISK